MKLKSFFSILICEILEKNYFRDNKLGSKLLQQKSIGFTARESMADINLKHNLNKATPASVSQMYDLPKDKKQNDQEKKITHFQEIYKHYVTPHHLTFGYLKANNIPMLFEKRLESINGGNHFTGQVTWYNGMGGYGEHRWNLAQGKL